ncbi:Leucine-rich repeat containing protein [Entamoeba marina]
MNISSKHSSLQFELFQSIILYFTSVHDLRTFIAVSKKCHMSVSTSKRNINLNNDLTQQEVALFSGAKILCGKISKIVEVSIEDTDDAVEWEAIASLCNKFSSMKYTYPLFFDPDRLRLQAIFERAKNVTKVVLITGALVKLLSQPEIQKQFSLFNLSKLVICDCDLSNPDHMKVLTIFPQFLKTPKGSVIISHANSYDDVLKAKSLIPSHWIIVLNDVLLVNRAKSSDVLLSPSICSKGYCIDDSIEDNQQLTSIQQDFIDKYLPTISLRYATHESIIPKNTRNLVVTGQFPKSVFTTTTLCNLTFKCSESEHQTEFYIHHLTNLTKLVFQSYEKRNRKISFPSTLKSLKSCYESNDNGVDIVDSTIHKNGLLELTKLTKLRLVHYNKNVLNLPTSLKNIELRYCNATSINGLKENTKLTTLTIQSCSLTSLVIPCFTNYAKLVDCQQLSHVHLLPKFIDNVHLDVMDCPHIELI